MDEDLKRLLDTMHAETKRHFDAVAEGVRSDVKAVAEGVGANTEQIGNLRSEMDNLRSEMQEEFAQVLSLPKFSHTKLDGRVRALEEKH